MAGVISGTAITNSLGLKRNLDTITLTINCVCNYKCPHCYLDYKDGSQYITDGTIEQIFRLNFNHLAIVGKEPFADSASIKISKRLIDLCFENNRTISFVTNGSNLGLLQDFDLEKVKFIDVSFDGGINSYKQYRGGDINKILQNINLLKKNGLKEVNALHLLSEKTIPFLSDMINLNSYSVFDKMMFSSYLETNGFNSRDEKRLSLKTILYTLQKSDDFINSKNTLLLIDKYTLFPENELTVENIESYINELKLKSKTFLVKEDPIEYGFIRITYNGFVLTPSDSLHTIEYDAKQIPIHEFNEHVFKEMFFAEKKIEITA